MNAVEIEQAISALAEQTFDPAEFPDHFGFFLPLAGITTVQQLRRSSFDIRATSRLNRLYVELRKDNPAWDTAERRLFSSTFRLALSIPTRFPCAS